MVNIAVLGYGTVGSGVVEVINTNHDIVNKRAGQEINVKRVLDLREFPGDPVENILTHDFEDILNDDDISVVVEVMGGVEPAYTFVKKCLLAGKSVATSNKELVAVHGPELIKIARESNINFFFEASAGGGIPVIRPLNTSITADDVTEITGILNGTTNYILTKMDKEGADYATVLKQAQELGYAERNPEADVEGGDACRKIAILTSLVYGKNLDYNRIHMEGITRITTDDFKYADKMGYSVKLVGTTRKTDGKLLGTSRREEGGLFALVAPMMVAEDHPLYSVNDVFNAILVKGNALGDVMFYGKGAGKLPTASAVVSDVIDAVKNAGRHVPIIWEDEELEMGTFADSESRFFVRTDEKNEAAIKAVFGDVEYVDSDLDEKAFVTAVITEGEFEACCNKIGVKSALRVLD